MKKAEKYQALLKKYGVSLNKEETQALIIIAKLKINADNNDEKLNRYVNYYADNELGGLYDGRRKSFIKAYRSLARKGLLEFNDIGSGIIEITDMTEKGIGLIEDMIKEGLLGATVEVSANTVSVSAIVKVNNKTIGAIINSDGQEIALPTEGLAQLYKQKLQLTNAVIDKHGYVKGKPGVKLNTVDGKQMGLVQ